MRLIELNRLTPIRNEEGKIYKWEEKLLLICPTNILHARFEEAVDHVVVRLRSGDELIVDFTLKEFAKAYEAATRESL